MVIDGDSTSSDEENEVMFVQPRKRTRASIAATDDEADVDTDEWPHAHASRATAGAKRQEESDDEDDVQIVQVGSNKSTPSSAKKARRLTILDSDEEEQERNELRKDPLAALRASVGDETARRPSPRLQTPQPSAVATRRGSSSSRRSSRIATKQEKKAALGSGARKLEFLSLENCLEPMAQKPFGNEDISSNEESESDVAPPVKRRQSLQVRQETESERVYADHDDMDEFIVADDEVEYMDENEEGVISVQSSSDEEGGTGDEEARAAHAAAMQTREPKEWFSIYLSYLEECILNADLDDLMRRSRVNPQHMMFKEAIRHVRYNFMCYLRWTCC